MIKSKNTDIIYQRDDCTDFPRSILVHYHIYKNAGTSVDWSLEKAFGKSWLNFDGDGSKNYLTTQEMYNFIENRPSIQALSSHLLRPKLNMDSIYPILFLRHPIVRAYSAYLFARRDPTQLDHCIALNNTFADYIEWSMATPNAGIAIKNYQVIHLSCCDENIDNFQDNIVSQNNLHEAVDILQNMPLFGLVNEFQKSCKMFTDAYKKIFPSFELFNVSLNQSSLRSPPDFFMIELIKQKIGVSSYNKLIDKNELDLELLKIANILFFNKFK